MSDTTVYFIQASLYLIALWFCMELGIKKATNYKFSRRFLLIGMGLAILLPFLSFPNNVLSQQQPIVGNYIMDVIHIGQNSSFPIEVNYLAIIYFIGFSIFSLKFVLSLIKLGQLYGRSIPKEGFRELPNSSMAFSFFTLIFIGGNINAKDKTAILQHEKVHVNQYHTVELILSKMMSIVFWFNPFVYKIHQQLIEIHEYEADALSCKETEYYTNLLLQQHFQFFDQSIIHPFNANHLKHRIMRLQAKTHKKANKTIILISLLAFCTIFMGKQYLQAADFNTQNNKELVQTPPPTENVIQQDSTEMKVIEPKDLDKNVEYPGGDNALYQFLANNIKYPADAKKAGIEGTVYIRCIIGPDGNLVNLEILRGATESLDQAAIEGVKKIERWEAAEEDGNKVTSHVTFPIKFNLAKKDKDTEK